jgi:hypothetical protein
MDANAYLGEAIAGLVYLLVAVRLYWLSRRTGQLPEKLIAASFVFWTLSYALYDIPYAFVDSEELIPVVYSSGSLIAIGLGNTAFAFFIRAVFRPDARWALALVIASAVSLGAGVAGMAYVGDWEGTNPLGSPWYWLENLGTFAPITWMGVEGLARYFKTRKQLKLGLCEPMTCNRFLLWGLAGSLWVILEAVVTLSDLVYTYTGQWSEPLGLAIALLEIVPITIVCFVFFPPDFYCRWVERSGKPAAA